MHPAFIIAELKVRGYRPIDVAKACDVTRFAVHNTIYSRPFPSPKVQKQISEIIEKPIEEIWPDREPVAA